MSSNLYQNGIKLILDRTIDLASDTIKVMLLGTGYTPDPDHVYVSDIVANEVSGTGYTGGYGGSGRKALASKTIGKDDTNNRANFDAADVSFGALDVGTIGFAAVFKEITSDAASPLICLIDVANLATNGGPVTLTFDTAGVFWINS